MTYIFFKTAPKNPSLSKEGSIDFLFIILNDLEEIIKSFINFSFSISRIEHVI